MGCSWASQTHTLMLLEVVQNEVWHRPSEITTDLMQPHSITDAGFKPFSDNSLDALSHQFFPEAAETWTHLTTEHVSTVFLSI